MLSHQCQDLDREKEQTPLMMKIWRKVMMIFTLLPMVKIHWNNNQQSMFTAYVMTTIPNNFKMFITNTTFKMLSLFQRIYSLMYFLVFQLPGRSEVNDHPNISDSDLQCALH